MDRRLLTLGLLTIAAGVALLAYLATSGVLEHPATAASEYGTAEFLAIGASFLAMTVGVLVTFRSLVVLPEPE